MGCTTGVTTALENYTSEQIDTVVDLCIDLCHRYPAITLSRIVGHQDVAMPRGRKTDPGPHFPWEVVRQRIAAATEGVIV